MVISLEAEPAKLCSWKGENVPLPSWISLAVNKPQLSSPSSMPNIGSIIPSQGLLSDGRQLLRRYGTLGHKSDVLVLSFVPGNLHSVHLLSKEIS